MEKEKRVLAFDFGASSGRAMLGELKDGTITMQEVHRFSNDPVIVNQTMYWDVLRLLYEIKQGLVKAKRFGSIESIGIDTWGVDFGLLDKDGYLLENPVHYRDARTAGMMEQAFGMLPREEFYQITGNQFMEINTVFQLLSLKTHRPELLERADAVLLMPDLFIYLLTGIKVAEYSEATTTQILDARQRDWSQRILQALDLPAQLFQKIIPTATVVGTLSDAVCEELEIEKSEVIAVAGHDTQCAMAAVPTQEDDFVFISCGTWSLLGTELLEPLINADSERFNITNEGGYGGKASFLKNIIGLWLIQESRRQWIREGEELGFGELEQMAKTAAPLQCFIDPDAPEFVPAGNIPRRIRAFCERTGQYVPQSKAEIVRCINESLALKYRVAVEELQQCTGKVYDTIHLLGGGIQSKLLCQFTANASQKHVVAGPVEATVLGNMLLQWVAKGEIADLKEGRHIIANSPDIASYTAEDGPAWKEAYERFKKILV
ncbi:MAG: rhamnulokinase [Lachnospiraceae bacterium]